MKKTWSRKSRGTVPLIWQKIKNKKGQKKPTSTEGLVSEEWGGSGSGSQFHKIEPLTFKTNLCSHLPNEIGLFQWKASGDTLKMQAPPATLIYAYPYI